MKGGGILIKSIKIRLLPTKEQEILMIKSIGVARFAYNWGLVKWEEIYRDGLKSSKARVRKEFNEYKKDFDWIKEVSSKTIDQSFDDLQNAYNNFLTGISQKPKLKTKKNSKKSFYVRYDSVYFKNNKVNIEKIGKVKYKTDYKIPKLDKYVNPRCQFDGKYWYLTLGFEQNENQVELNKNLSVGIDLGVKDLATVNCLENPIKNINKTQKIKKLKKRLKRLQRQVSRKYDNLKDGPVFKKGKKLKKTQNIIKLEKQIKLIHRKLSNIRNNHIHQATATIIKLKPYRVVMENLDLKTMMKNKHLSKFIKEQNFYEFKRQMKYKCEFNGIEFVLADRFYPSSKTCSCCGKIKTNLKLNDRIFNCECGLVIDRDLNAAINLSSYKSA